MNNEKLKRIGIGLLVLLGCVLALTLKLQFDIYRERNNKVTCDTPEQAFQFVKDHSNIFSDSILSEVSVAWPQENFIIDLASTGTGKTYIFYCNGKDTIKIPYKPVSFNIANKPASACKNFTLNLDTIKNSIKGDLLSAIDSCQSISIDTKYENQINGAPNTFSEQDKKLSRIYNILSGNYGGHVILGRNTSNKAWKCYQLKDFPEYYLDENKLLHFVQYHLQNKDLSPSECFEKYRFITQLHDLHIVYYDYRRDTLIEKNGVRVCKIPGKEAPSEHDLKDVKLSKGWLNYKVINPDKTNNWKLVSAYDYYVGGKRRFVTFGSPKEKNLDTAIWEKSHATPLWVLYILYLLSGVLTIAGLVFLLIGIIFVKKPEKKEDDDEFDVSSDKVKTLKEQIENLKKQVEELNKRPTHKKIEELEAQIEDLKKRPTPKQVKDLQERAVYDYKTKNDIDNELIRAKNWKTLVTTESVRGVISILDNIRRNHSKFPQLETLKSVYDSAVESSKDLVEQILYVLSQLEAQVKSTDNWRLRIEKMRKEEEYANKVRKQYERIATYVDIVKKREEIMGVLSKDNHNYLDLIAYTHWAIEGFNTLMGIFTQNGMSKNIEKSMQDALLSNLMQLFITRVFLIDYEDGKPAGSFVSDRKEKVSERLRILENEYHIHYMIDERFSKTAQSLDSAYDQIRSTDEFVNRMYETFVNEFSNNVETNKDKAWFFGMMVAMGYHTVDFVQRKKDISISLCPNYIYLLSNFDNSKLPEESYFNYKDYAHSVEYTNRIYEWLDEIGVQHLKALVGRQLIKP